jgi:hypothetical protein
MAAWLLASPAYAEVVDRVVASVGEQLVTESEVRLEAVISALDPSPSPFWDRERRPPVDRLVDAAVIRELAGDVSLYQPSDEALALRVDAIRALFPDRSAWDRFLESWGLDEDALRGIVRRRMLVERYLARNVPVPTTDADAWWRGYDAFVTPLRARYRIRMIPPMAQE